MIYPKKILAMLRPRGFDERYYFYCKTSKTYQNAYEKTENEFFTYFQMRKYKSFDSFRVSHNKRIIRKILDNLNNLK